jgi:hypothetical protein
MLDAGKVDSVDTPFAGDYVNAVLREPKCSLALGQRCHGWLRIAASHNWIRRYRAPRFFTERPEQLFDAHS